MPEELRCFHPSAERGSRLDNGIHLSLKSSLQHIRECCESELPEIARSLDRPISILESGGRFPPSGFGEYFELGECLLDGKSAEASKPARALSKIEARPPGLSFHRRGSAESATLDETLDRRLGTESGDFAVVPEPVFLEFKELVLEGLDLLKRGFPDLHGEIVAMISDLLFAQAPQGALMEFDGASHYQFWGLLMLNPKHHRTPLAVAEVLAHESGHSLLFGLTIEEALVHNPDEELYPSPLRHDPRPMDGIYHATFVSARMALAMEVLAASGLLTGAECDQAIAAARKDRENFAMGYATVKDHGRLSAPGKEILENARTWVESGKF